MHSEYPQYTSQAKLGDQGIIIVSRIVHENFGWLFKRNHQEHDFGVDAHTDEITQEGKVTGRILAMQIKCGESFFGEKNKWGFVYRGEQKHFNYLINYPIPVLIIICDPKSQNCHWVRFDPKQIQKTEKAWKITIPYENDLKTSKGRIESVLPPLFDGNAKLKSYWAINNIIMESQYIIFPILKREVVTLNTSRPRKFFDHLRSTKELAYECQGKVEISFSGYHEDTLELFEIDEVRKYIVALEHVLPELFFFIVAKPTAHTLKVIALCLSEFSFPEGHPTPFVARKIVLLNNDNLKDFLMRHFIGLNEMTEWLSMSMEENKKITFDIARCLGMQISEGINEGQLS